MYFRNRGKIIIFHHNDPDGYVSGLLLALYFASIGLEYILIKCSHGSDFDISQVNENDRVYIADLPYMPEVEKIVGVSNITWLDHHKSSIKELDRSDIPGIRSCSMSGCELVYLFLYGSDEDKNYVKSYDKFSRADKRINNIRDNAKNLVKTVGDYDNWDHRSKDSLPLFMSICQTVPLNVEGGFDEWKTLLDIFELQLILEKYKYKGNIILEYLANDNIKMLSSNAAECKIKGFEKFKAIICNTSSKGSLIFESVKDKYDIGIIYQYNKNNKLGLSLYSLDESNKDIDVSVICKKFGGGGHEGAAGFHTDDLKKHFTFSV